MRLLIHAWRDLANPQAGGSERLVDRIASGMSARGHDVTLACGGPIGERSYEVVRVGGTYTQYLRMPLYDLRHRRHVDLVLDIANGATFCTPLWRRGATVLLVHHVHTEQWPLTFPRPIAAAGSWFERRLVPRIYARCLVTTVSPSTAADLGELGVPSDQIRLMHNAVDVPIVPLDVDRSAEPLFVALGRLVPHKRVDVLLGIWERVHREIGGRLVVIGDGPERGAIDALAASTGGVEVMGRVDESTKEELLASAWLLVHAASHEGWGIAISEAAAHGTPSLAFDAPGVRDAIRDGDTGCLVGEGDHAGFARAWMELTRDPARRELLGSAARAWVTSLDNTRTVDRFEEIATEALERHAMRGRPNRAIEVGS